MVVNTVAVLLFETHALLRQHIAGFLREIDDTSIAVTDIGLLDELEPLQLSALRPDVVLLGAESDVGMIHHAIPQVRDCFPDAAIIVLGLLDADEYRQATLAAGADAFIVKDTLNISLLPTIQQVIRVCQEKCV